MRFYTEAEVTRQPRIFLLDERVFLSNFRVVRTKRENFLFSRGNL